MNSTLQPRRLTFVVINGKPSSYGYSTDDDPPRVYFQCTLSKQELDGAKIMFLQPDDDDWEDFHQQFDDDAWECDLCGGDGVRELHDAPEEWGEDCCVEKNRLIPCRGCAEVEREKNLAMCRFLLKQIAERSSA